jgi:hypothetical protein
MDQRSRRAATALAALALVGTTVGVPSLGGGNGAGGGGGSALGPVDGGALTTLAVAFVLGAAGLAVAALAIARVVMPVLVWQGERAARLAERVTPDSDRNAVFVKFAILLVVNFGALAGVGMVAAGGIALDDPVGDGIEAAGAAADDARAYVLDGDDDTPLGEDCEGENATTGADCEGDDGSATATPASPRWSRRPAAP